MSSITEERPQGFERWNRAMRGAFNRGMRDKRAGVSMEDCPYEDKRKPSGRLSWSRAFIRAWQDGWHWENGKRGTGKC